MSAAEVIETVSRAQFVDRIKAFWHRSREYVFAMGQALIDAKANLPHGEFTVMVENELPFGPQSARLFMRIASDEKLTNHQHADVLPRDVTAIDQLRKLPAPAFERLADGGRINADMTRDEARALVREYQGREPPEPREVNQNYEFREPADGMTATCYAELGFLFVKRRQSLGWSQEHLDDIAGWNPSYTSHLERPPSGHGKAAVQWSFDIWLASLGLGIQLVPLKKA